MTTSVFILNPKAGRGAARRLIDPLCDQMRRRGIRSSLLLTTRAGEAAELARHADADVVVAVGGDGTVQEVANGLAGSRKALGVVPAGSGNDFMRSIALPKELDDALDLITAGKTRQIDLGTIAWSGKDDGNGGNCNSGHRCFVNGVGFGFAASVAARTADIANLSGTALYLVAVLESLRSYRSPVFEVDVDGARRSSRYLLIGVGNGKSIGGGFLLTPNARVDDGRLDICFIDEVSIPRIISLIPSALQGKLHEVKEVNVVQGKTIVLRADSPFSVHADGEILGTDLSSVRIGLSGEQLSVISG